MKSPNINNVKKRKRNFYLILLSGFFMLCVTGWFWLDKWSKKHGFEGAGDFISTVSVNYWSSLDAEYETAEITINDSDFAKLSDQRQAHLKRGIITKNEERYVAGEINFRNKKINCRIRLKGHMIDHLQDGKWSFRVKTTDGGAFMGMRILSLMHPGTRNYIYEWIYHQLLEEEGIATVRYSFIKLKINGESWGIYAVEENFAEDLIEHHRLPAGPILGFNPDMYWYARLNEHEHKKVNLDNFFFNATYPEAYDEKESIKSEEQRRNYAEALVKLDKFISGELKTSQVFDVDKLAKFHAVLDLVGGQFSLDWSDVKYYYNPQTQKLEPVGYESFSVRNSAQLCGASKFRNKNNSQPEFHELLFSDAEFFAAYLKQLERISDKKYLKKFFSKKEYELANNLAILYSEFAYKKLPLNQYYRNQENIKALLNEPVTNVCYLENIEEDTLYFTMGNTGVLPLVINSLSYNDSLINLENPIFTSVRKKNEIIYYETVKIPFQKPKKFKAEKLKLSVCKVGTNKETIIEVKPVDFFNTQNNFSDFNLEKPNIEKFDFLVKDESLKIITIQNGEHLISENLIIPDGYRVFGSAPLRLILNNHAAIISFSPFIITGTEESPVEFTSTDSTGKGLIILAKEKSEFIYTEFTDLAMDNAKSETHDAQLNFYESNVVFSNCTFSSDAAKAISVIRSSVHLKSSSFFNFKNAFYAGFSDFVLEDCIFSLSKGTAVEFCGSTGKLNSITIKNAGKAMKADNGSLVTGEKLVISNCKTGIIANDFSIVKLSKVSLTDLEVGLEAEKKTDAFGPARIIITGLTKKSVKSISETDNESTIQIK